MCLLVMPRFSIPFLFLLALTSGCARTVIPPTRPTPASSLAQRMLPRLPVQITSAAPPHFVTGTQFVLLFVPLGELELVDPKAFLETAVYEQMLRRGAIAVPTQGAALAFTLNDISVTVWDFLATRRVVVRTEIAMSKEGRGLIQTQRCSSFHPYPFGEVLQHEIQKCIHATLATLWRLG